MASVPHDSSEAQGLESPQDIKPIEPGTVEVIDGDDEYHSAPDELNGASKLDNDSKDKKIDVSPDPEAPSEELDDFGLPLRLKKPNRRSNTVPDLEESADTTDETPPSEDLNQKQSLPLSVSPPPTYMDSEVTNPTTADENKVELKDKAESSPAVSNKPQKDAHAGAVSEWSHQKLTTKDESNDDSDDDLGWQEMPALGEFDVYDDYGKVVARGSKIENEAAAYQGLGGAGRGYTKVQLDDDAASATSLDEDTSYLFKEPQSNALGVEDDDLRDPVSQLEATKDLLTEGQRIAYVGVTRLTIFQMVQHVEAYKRTRGTKKCVASAVDSITKWGQQIMIRLYTHMDISSDEQIMIEQLAEHGVQPSDLVTPLMRNARIENPLAEESVSEPKTPLHEQSPKADSSSEAPEKPSRSSSPPPPYEDNSNHDLPEVQSPSEIDLTKNLDIDLRWTVLCDLFLVLIADATYDARSRKLLESVGDTMKVSWTQICRFEKRIIDALEMQEEASKESWDEAGHLETRRKGALKRRYMIMGLATVGGGLVIGLSAGLLAPVIGAGLAAGFTTIGVSGTGAFLGGVGGTALITSGATISGTAMGIRASNRRTSAVRTFEYRPLHNNKRLNLIVTVSGWMNGKVDDVRLPFSTVDPIMGDIYSVLWEPEMLQSTGQTINILATEALTQGLQQVLGATILTALMASLQLPIVLSKLSYLIDNPWNVSLVRANAAGLVLADSIIDKNLGNRPITLLGFSLGSRLIFSCLKELANKEAFGLVQNVYLFGSPIVVKNDEYIKARSVVSGRFVNGYASNDWILGYLFRATSGGIMRVAGLAPVEDVPGVENIDVTHLVNGHMAYRTSMPRLLREVGWDVESDEFTEIEDPDPDKHQERQRELMREIDEARKEAEVKPDKKRFGFFKRGKLAEKKGWETYDVDSNGPEHKGSSDGSGDLHDAVLFDIDAIRAELASEQIEVKQLESTLPPINLDQRTPSPVKEEPVPKSPNPKQTPTKEQDLESPSPTTTISGNNDLPNGHLEKTPSRNDDINSSTSLHTTPRSYPAQEDTTQMTFDTSYHTPTSQTSFAEKASHDPSATPASPIRDSSREFANIDLSRNAWAEQHEDYSDSNIKMSFQ